MGQELFIMGLFSAIDIMLGKTMEESLDMVVVPKDVKLALLNNEGEFAPVLNFIKRYEDADWTEISRLMVLGNMSMTKVYEAYLSALRWYRDLFPVRQ
jgi:EAL and modified HD-GYP domain-containing signal transduction protein